MMTGINAYLIMLFEDKTYLLDKLFPEEFRKSLISVKFLQEKLILKNIKRVEKYFGRKKWMDEAENDLKTKTEEQILKDAEFYWRCEKENWPKAKEAWRKGAKNYFVREDGRTGIHYAIFWGETELAKSYIARVIAHKSLKLFFENFES